jgi:DNA polymerase III sliding clamp (beta) subunit (PCNA family)
VRFSIDRDPLAAALRRVALFADPKSPIALWGCVKLDVTETGLSLSAADKSLGATIQLPLMLPADPGAICTPAARLAKLTASLRPDEPVEIGYSLQSDRTVLTLQSGLTLATLAAANPADFPTFNPSLPAPQIRVKAGELDRVLAMMIPAMGDDADRIVLWGLSLAYERNSIAVAACDGVLGAVCRMHAHEVSEFPSIILPRPLCIKLRTLLKDDLGMVEISITPSTARIAASDWVIVSALINGEFPSPKHWTAASVEHPVIIDSEEFAAILARISAAVDFDSEKLRQRGAIATFNDGVMHLRDARRLIEDQMVVAYGTETPNEMAFNTIHMQTAISAISATKIELHFIDRGSAIRICALGEPDEAFTTTPYRA